MQILLSPFKAQYFFNQLFPKAAVKSHGQAFNNLSRLVPRNPDITRRYCSLLEDELIFLEQLRLQKEADPKVELPKRLFDLVDVSVMPAFLTAKEINYLQQNLQLIKTQLDLLKLGQTKKPR